MVFTGLLKFITSFLTQSKTDTKNYAETDKAIEKFFDKTFGNVINKKKEIQTRIDIMNKIYDSYNDITKPVKINFLAKNEVKKRETNQNKALEITKKSFKAYIKKSILIPSLTIYKNKQVDRPLQHILCPDIESMSEKEMIEFNDKLQKMTSKELNQLIRNNLKRFDNFMDDIIFAKTDEEFLRKCDGNASLFNAIGELQFNKTTKEHFKAIFGCEIDKDVEEKWKKLTAKGVDTAAMSNRLGYLLDNNYCVFETSEAQKLYDWFDRNDIVISKNVTEPELLKGKIFEESNFDMLNYAELNGPYIDTLSSYANTLGFHAPDFDKLIIATNLKLLIDLKQINNPIYKDDNGNIIEKNSAINKLYNNKHINIYNGDLFEQSVKIENSFFCVTKPKEFGTINFDYCSKETLNKQIDNMLYQLDKGNPWYMKARNIIAPNDYQKMVNLLNDLKSDKKYDKEKTINTFNRIKDLSSKYLNRKENDGKDKSDLTDQRIEAATYIHDYVNYCVSVYDMQKNEISVESTKSYDEKKEELTNKILANDLDLNLQIEGLSDDKVESNPELSIDNNLKI